MSAESSAVVTEDMDPLTMLSAQAGLAAVDAAGKVPVMVHADLTVTARHLGQIVSQRDLFEMNGEMIYFDHRGERKVMNPVRFRTWASEEVLIYEKRDKNTDLPVPSMLTKDAAGAILESDAFQRGVRPLRGMNSVRLPVVRPEGRLDLLPYGYDDETGIMTVEGGVKYDVGMDLEAAKAWLGRIFGWVPVVDERSFSVLVAGLLALYVRHLPHGTDLRPGFIVRGNKPGCGKSVVVKSWQYPVLGRAPAVKMKKGEQLDKEIEAFMISGVPVLFMDNVYGKLQSATIDQMLTSEESEGRAMGGHGLFRAKNSALLMISANNIEGNDDAARRFLLVDLHESKDITERKPPEDELLDDHVMKTTEWRSRMLSICWAFVKHWHEKGMPRGSVLLPSFERYSALLGGIVECAGYINPFTVPAEDISLNPESAEFMKLFRALVERAGSRGEIQVERKDLVIFCRERGILRNVIGDVDDGITFTIELDKLYGEARTSAVDKGYLGGDAKSDTKASQMLSNKLMKYKGQVREFEGVAYRFLKCEGTRHATWGVERVVRP